MQTPADNYKQRIAIAIFWLSLIYIFLPVAPDVFDFIFERLGWSQGKRLLALLTITGALFSYLPFINKFGLKRALPYVIVTITLAIACAVNITLKIPAQTLHIPEYAILSVLLYNAFIIKYNPKKSYILATLIGICAGIADEAILQNILPMRYYDLTDILLNNAGSVIGIILISAYRLNTK